MKETVFSLMMLLMAIGAHAQSSDAHPRPPYSVSKVPDLSHWTVEYIYAGKAGDSRPTAPLLSGRRIMKSDSIRTGEMKREINSHDGGLQQDIWSRGTLSVLRYPNYANEIVRQGAGAEVDFPEFFWLDNAAYKGKESVEGVECWVFQSEIYPLQLEDAALFAAEMAQDIKTIELGDKVSVTAYINTKTLLPIKMIVDKDSRVYKFLEPVTSPLEMPANYVNAIKDVESRYNAIVKPLAKP